MNEAVHKSSDKNDDDDTFHVRGMSIFLAFDDEIAFLTLNPRNDLSEIVLTIGFDGAKVFPSFNLEVRLVR